MALPLLLVLGVLTGVLAWRSPKDRPWVGGVFLGLAGGVLTGWALWALARIALPGLDPPIGGIRARPALVLAVLAAVRAWLVPKARPWVWGFILGLVMLILAVRGLGLVLWSPLPSP